MDEPDDLSFKALIEQALTECHDIELLDLIYKLLMFNNQ